MWFSPVSTEVSMEVQQMIKQTTFDTAVLLWGVHLGDNSQGWHRNTWASVLPAVWFIV